MLYKDSIISLDDVINLFISTVKPQFVGLQNQLKEAKSNKIFDNPEELIHRDNQPWKKNHTLDLLSWCIHQIKKPNFGSIQHLFFPPIINLIQDFEVEYKIMGIKLLRYLVIQESISQDVKKTGLLKLFFKDLMTAITYHSSPDLVQVSLDLLLDLIDFFFERDSKSYLLELENVLNDGILRGLIYALGTNDSIQNVRTLEK